MNEDRSLEQILAELRDAVAQLESHKATLTALLDQVRSVEACVADCKERVAKLRAEVELPLTEVTR